MGGAGGAIGENVSQAICEAGSQSPQSPSRMKSRGESRRSRAKAVSCSAAKGPNSRPAIRQYQQFVIVVLE
jgi:hypothetical protein